MDVAFPSEVVAELDDLVRLGEFPDRAAAVVELVRQGLSYRYRRSPSPPMPLAPNEPPGRREPRLPDDVNWIP